MSEYIQGLMQANPNDPFAPAAPSMTEILLRGIAGALPPPGQLRVRDTGLGRTAGLGLRLGGSLAGIIGEEMARRRADPLGRILPVAQEVVTGLRNVQVPGENLQIGGPAPVAPPPGLFQARAPTEFPGEPPELQLPGRKAASIEEARQYLDPALGTKFAALELAAPQTLQRAFPDAIKEQQRQLNEFALKKAPIEVSEAQRKQQEAVADQAREDQFRARAQSFMSILDPKAKDYARQAANGLAKIAAEVGVLGKTGLFGEFMNLANAEVRLEIQKAQAATLAEYRKLQRESVEERTKKARELQGLNATRLSIQNQITNIDKKLDMVIGTTDKAEAARAAQMAKQRDRLMKDLQAVQERAAGVAGLESDTNALLEMQKMMQGIIAGY